MRNRLHKLPQEIKDLIYLASNIATENNMPVYLVGGFVRDLLLEVKNLDLDFVIEGDGIKFAEDLATILKARLIRHRRFGTATIVLNPVRVITSFSRLPIVSRGVKIDIATARRETYPRPASLPLVTRGTLEDDLARRDFSVNAMAISITKKDFGKLVDFFCGKDDLQHKKVRILHSLSFIDDPTRMLRAIRFEQRYNFKIEPHTLKLLKVAAAIKMLEKVQPQRLRDELILILKEAHPLRQIKRIQELIGLNFIHPRLIASGSTYKLFRSIEQQIEWFKIIYPQRRQLDTWLIYFMGLLDAFDIGDVKNVCKKFVFCKGEEKRILSYKNISHKIMSVLGLKKVRSSLIFNLLEPLSYEVIILIKARYKNKCVQRHIEDFFEIYNGMRILISGHDLHKLGIAPGPYYQKIFSRVLKAKLEGEVRTRQEELELIRKLVVS